MGCAGVEGWMEGLSVAYIVGFICCDITSILDRRDLVSWGLQPGEDCHGIVASIAVDTLFLRFQVITED